MGNEHAKQTEKIEEVEATRNTTSKPHTSYKFPVFTDGILFAQLPHEINVMILNLLDASTLIKYAHNNC